MIADLIIINKTDLNSENLPKIKSHISELNPFANITQTSYCTVTENMFRPNNTKAGNTNLFNTKVAGGRPEKINACVLRTHDKLAPVQVKPFIKTLSNTCPRIKGFLNLSDKSSVSIHSVFDNIEITTLENYIGRSELIAFGNNLTIKYLRQQFDTFLTKF